MSPFQVKSSQNKVDCEITQHKIIQWNIHTTIQSIDNLRENTELKM